MKKTFRHKNSHGREVALQGLYQSEIGGHSISQILRFTWLNEPLPQDVAELTEQIIQGVLEHQDRIDQVIDALSEKDATQISTVVRCILRMGIYEMLLGSNPARIIIDDLCDLTRRYDVEESVAFVNGILDAYRKRRQSKPGNEEESGPESTDI
ncbi:MAG: transcription antitermination factor NusB [Leptospiraceae bacterium]|nr:transcription antitermination factor NusB [Leptospiraceae bacterium]MCB1304077.1 transcription antitermination factor NusB [Leptospiraceae bacterium]